MLVVGMVVLSVDWKAAMTVDYLDVHWVDVMVAW